MADDDLKAAWIGRVLGIAVGGDDQLRKSLLEAITDAVILAVSLPDEMKRRVADMAKAAKALAEGKDLVAAGIAVEQLQAFRESAAKTGRMDDVASVVTAGTVKWLVLRNDWRHAQSASRNELIALRDTIKNDKRLENDPYRDDVMEAIGDLADILPNFGAELEDLLSQLDEATDPDDAEALRGRALDVLDDYMAELEGADALRDIQQLARAEFGGCESFDELKRTLSGISKTIAAAG